KVLSGAGELGRRGWVQSVEERERGVASVSAPVRRDGAVVAAVSVSGPIERTTRSPGRKYAAATVAAARRVEEAMGWPAEGHGCPPAGGIDPGGGRPSPKASRRQAGGQVSGGPWKARSEP